MFFGIKNNQVRFGSISQSHLALRRKRLLVMFLSTLVFSSLFIIAMFIFTQPPAVAVQQTGFRPANGGESSFGTVVLLAPAEMVRQGEKLGKVQLREIYSDRDKVPEGAIRSTDDIGNLYARVNLSPGQPILADQLSSNPPSFGISDLLPAGSRAVTIEVDSTASVEGWATPGAHVDVLLTYFDSNDSVNKTRVAVEDAVVLSYNGSTKKFAGTESDKVPNSSTVTLAVSFEDALKMQTARAMGRISLILRNNSDNKRSGQDVWGSNEWEKKSKREAANKGKGFAPQGFAKYTTADGSSKEFVLGEDRRWWVNEGREEN